MASPSFSQQRYHTPLVLPLRLRPSLALAPGGEHLSRCRAIVRRLRQHKMSDDDRSTPRVDFQLLNPSTVHPTLEPGSQRSVLMPNPSLPDMLDTNSTFDPGDTDLIISTYMPIE